jgi:hypothetical protein
MPDSILNTTKKALGLEADYTPFDSEIIMHINSVFGTLNQLGIGPIEGYAITDASNTWDEVIATDLRLNGVMSYMYFRVKMLFDPPSTGYVMTAMEKMILEMEWRLNTAREDIDYPMPIDGEVVPPSSEIVYDGGGA